LNPVLNGGCVWLWGAWNFSRAGAKRLLDSTQKGLNVPLDGHIWYQNTVYSTPTDYTHHPMCNADPCPTSIRTWLNGELPNNDYPD
jgi:hypothetical protein